MILASLKNRTDFNVNRFTGSNLLKCLCLSVILITYIIEIVISITGFEKKGVS